MMGIISSNPYQSKSNHLQLRNHLVALRQEDSSVINQFVDDGLGRLLLVDHGGGLTHQVRTGVVNGVIVNIIRQVLEVVLDRDDTLGGEFLDLLGAVLLPVLDVGVLADTKWTTLAWVSLKSWIREKKKERKKETHSEDNGANSVIKAGGTDSLLVSLRSTSLISQDEAGTNPDSRGTQHQSGSNGLTVVQTTSRNDLHGLTSHRALLAPAQLGNGGDKEGSGDIPSVSTTLTTLSADDICAGIQRFLNVLGVADHVHVEDSVAVESVDNVLRGDTDSGDEELSAALDDDVDEFVEFPLGVVVAKEEQRISIRP